MTIDPTVFLEGLFRTAVEAADPHRVLAQHLPAERTGRAIVIGAGKAAASMAAAFEQAWHGPTDGLVVTRYGHSEPCRFIEVVEAGHPLPDDAGERSARRILDLVSGLSDKDTVIFLLSGGGSSLLALPAPGISLAEKHSVTRALLKSGATIDEINCVRKHLSAIKGGRLAMACRPAHLLTFAVSDVAGDDPSVIASGPSVADPTTCEDALAILQRYAVDTPPAVSDWLHQPEAETPKPHELSRDDAPYTLIATPRDSLTAAAEFARQHHITAIVLGDTIEGEAREVAKVHGGIAEYIARHSEPVAAPCVILSGGETTVTVKGKGRGGRNAEFLLGLAKHLRGHPGIYALAADTDGIDGSEDNAGALLMPEDFIRAEERGLLIDDYLVNNDGYGYFQALDRLLVTGPTRTNVNDFRAILVLPQ